LFSTGKITQINSPSSSNIGNVLTVLRTTTFILSKQLAVSIHVLHFCYIYG